ncbi:MAG: cation efflux system protein [Myxococcales bacterium]
MALHDTHDRHDHHGHDRSRETRSLRLTLLLTGTILVVEVVGGLLSGSLALLSDAGHMLGDVSAVVLSMLALRLAGRAADTLRTYGWYRLEILAALANGVVLLGIATFVVLEAIERLRSPQPVDSMLMLGVAVIGLAANAAALFVLHGSRSNLNVRSVFLHVMGDALSSVGVVVGAVLIAVTGNTMIDPILSCVIGVIITIGAVSLVRESAHILLEGVPAHIDATAVGGRILDVPGVEAVHDLHIWCLTSDRVALSAHIVVPPGNDMEESGRILHAVEALLVQEYAISHATLQIEARGYEHVAEIH